MSRRAALNSPIPSPWTQTQRSARGSQRPRRRSTSTSQRRGGQQSATRERKQAKTRKTRWTRRRRRRRGGMGDGVGIRAASLDGAGRAARGGRYSGRGRSLSTGAGAGDELLDLFVELVEGAHGLGRATTIGVIPAGQVLKGHADVGGERHAQRGNCCGCGGGFLGR